MVLPDSWTVGVAVNKEKTKCYHKYSLTFTNFTWEVELLNAYFSAPAHFVDLRHVRTHYHEYDVKAEYIIK